MAVPTPFTLSYCQRSMKRPIRIRRFDDEAKRTYGYLVQVQRNYRITTKFFSDGVYGSKPKALLAAASFRDQLLAEAHYEYQIWRRSIPRRNNRSGITGVGRYDTITGRRRRRRDIFWLAYWVNEDGSSGRRKFSVLAHGESKAKQLAIAERERQLKRVCTIKAENIASLLRGKPRKSRKT